MAWRWEPCVHVTGLGLFAEAIKRLVIRFFTSKHDGAGLGLAISQRFERAQPGALRGERR